MWNEENEAKKVMEQFKVEGRVETQERVSQPDDVTAYL